MRLIQDTLKSLGVTTLPKAAPKEKKFNLDQNQTVHKLQELSRNFAVAYDIPQEEALEYLFLAAKHNINQLIRDKKITDSQLALACKCDVRVLRNRIHNCNEMTSIELRAVCTTLDMTLEEITDSPVFLIPPQ